MDVRTYRGFSCGSDHCLIKMNFRDWIMTCYTDESSSVSVLDIGKLKDKEIREHLSSLISAKLNDNWQQLEVEDMWELMNSVEEAASSVLEPCHKRR
jgi:hypothetical protein